MSPFLIPPIACLLTAVALDLMLRRRWAGRLAMDVPNARSLHISPIPRAGGVAMMAATLAVSLPFLRQVGPILWLAVALCAVSFADDRWGLPVFVRLAAHGAAAAAYCLLAIQSSSLAPWLALFAIIWAANLYNFMDGADGLAGGMAVVGFGVLGWMLRTDLPWLAFLAFCLSAAAVGFLLFNTAPARVFMGDAGAVPLGFLAGTMGVEGWLHGIWPAWFPLLVFSPFVVDATATLFRRMLRQERFWQAHRDHYYQRLIRMGWSHRRLALAEYVLMAGAGLSALALLRAQAAVQWLAIGAWLALYLILMRAVDVRWERFLAREGAQ